MDNEILQKLTVSKNQEKEESTQKANLPKVPPSNALSPGHKRDSRRSSIPRPCSSSRTFAGAERSSTGKPTAEKVGAFNKSASHATKTCDSSKRTFTVNADKAKELQPQASNTIKTSLETSQRSDKGCTASSCLPRTPSGSRKEQSSLSCFKGSSAPTQSVKSADQQQQDRPNVSPEKKPILRNVMTAPPPCTSEEKRVGFSQPPPDSASGEWTKLLLPI